MHVDVNRDLINSAQNKVILELQDLAQLYFSYPSFLRVRKPGSNTHPYYFEWDFDLCKQVTAERASIIGVCWQTLHTEPGSGPLKPIGEIPWIISFSKSS